MMKIVLECGKEIKLNYIIIIIMPYFHNKDVNLLFIHIPKTGGTSISDYFVKKYNIPLNELSFAGFNIANNINVPTDHFTYKNIYIDYLLNLDLSNLKILTVVRNPYERLISHLFFFKLINLKSTPYEVECYILEIFTNFKDNIHINTNHILPQYEFINNIDNLDNLTIIKFEKLNESMHKLGYTDFNNNLNNNTLQVNYYDYLNNKSIIMINDFYYKDFELFEYIKK